MYRAFYGQMLNWHFYLVMALLSTAAMTGGVVASRKSDASGGGGKKGGTVVHADVDCLVGADAPWPDDSVTWVGNRSQSAGGYTTVTTIECPKTYLVDMDGSSVHHWSHDTPSAKQVYLTEDGTLYRMPIDWSKVKTQNSNFPEEHVASGLEEVSWDGDTLWSCEWVSPTQVLHHDSVKLPNGNMLALAWRTIDKNPCLGMGLDPDLPLGSLIFEEDSAGCLDDGIVELQPPTGPDGECTVVWEWWMSDHAIQDTCDECDKYGVVADHPELIDINYIYLGSAEMAGNAQFLHANSIDYDAEHDQVLISSFTKAEIYVIDHSTTTAQARTSSGGRQGRGGDLLWRWGNDHVFNRPAASVDVYSATPRQTIFHSHSASFVPDDGRPGGGMIQLFNNGGDRGSVQTRAPAPLDPSLDPAYSASVDTHRSWSSLDVVNPPRDRATGAWAAPVGGVSAPQASEWTYQDTAHFCSRFGGMQRLSNGNSLYTMADGGNPHFFVREVTAEGDTVWQLDNPFRGTGHPNPSILSLFRSYRYEPSYQGLRSLADDENRR
mmetsp:Transcript_928/g.3501  ORF Transcript_928/g.3501 Transcript_928/m.3501 type:complete len:549 (-) Transcript_928:118-1764(-)